MVTLDPDTMGHAGSVPDETDAELTAPFERDVIPLLDTLFRGACG